MTSDEQWDEELRERQQRWAAEANKRFEARIEKRKREQRRSARLKNRKRQITREAKQTTGEGEEARLRYLARVYGGMPLPAYPETPVCECCETPTWLLDSAIHLDHCHGSNEFRGWLCRKCNTGIGMLGDNIEGTLNALEYLLTHTPDVVNPDMPLKVVAYIRAWMGLREVTGLE